MLIYYLALIGIALVLDAVIILKMNISKIAYKGTGLLYFCYAIFLFGIIDICWGLTYYDTFGLGVVAHKVTSALFYSSSAILSYRWLMYASRFIEDIKTSRLVSIISFIPAFVVNVIVIMNIWNNKLFTMGDTPASYERGPWYFIYRIVIDGYYIAVIFKAINSFRKNRGSKRRYITIFAFSIIPLLVESLQSVDVLLPFTTLAYATSVLIIYIFISIEGENEIVKTAYYTNELALECITVVHQELDYKKSIKLLLEKLGENIKAERVYISESDRITIKEDFIWFCEDEKVRFGDNRIDAEIMVNHNIVGYIVVGNYPVVEHINLEMLIKTLAQFVAFKMKNKNLSDDLIRVANEKMQAIEASNRAKTTFLFNMSHDIRTPMNAILGFNEIARRNIDDKEKVMEALNKAKVSGEHMLGIINDILEMSRIESGKLELNEEVINVKEHIRSFMDMFELSMKGKGIEFIVVDETKEPYVYGDYLRITQVIANLLSNAMKFTPVDGRVVFKCTEKPHKKEKYVAYEISIKDNGIGMSEEFQKRVFKSFEREKTSTTSGIQGTGLGLAIAKNLALLMRGDLTCTSKIGKGTEFIFTFSARIAKGGSKLIEQAKVREVVLKGKRILVVEDNDLNREITAEILGAEGCFIEEAENGKVALEKVRTSKVGYYDLVLMDIQMPIMDGYEAVKHIRALENEALASVPIIAMTANAFEEDKRKAIETGMDAYVSKPIDIDKMLGTLMEILKNEE